MASILPNYLGQYFRGALLVWTGLAAVCTEARADFLGGLIGGVAQNIQNAVTSGASTNLASTIKSVATTSLGKLAPGILPEGDTKGKVILYGKSTCPFCTRAKNYMDQNQIPYVERDVNDPTYQAEFFKLNAKGAVPFMVFGDRTLLGCDGGQISANYKYMLEHQKEMDAQSKQASSSGLQPGDELSPKLRGVIVYAEADSRSKSLIRLETKDTVVYMGEESHGMYRVTSSAGEGWVNKLLVKAH